MKKLDELRLKLMLTLARDRQAMQGRVRSVGFMREYLTLPADLGVQTLSQMDEQELEELAHSVLIKPKSQTATFHFYLNDVRYHLLQMINNRITVIENATEEQWIKYETHAQLPSLLQSVKSYSMTTSYIGKDTTIPLSECVEEQILALLDYVWFKGTAEGPAIHQAESIFIFSDACNMNSWTIMNKKEAFTYALEHGYIEVTTNLGQTLYSLVLENK